MRKLMTGLAAAVLSFAAAAAVAAPLKLTPASPQPKGLKPGLAVQYAYPNDVKSLSQARSALQKGAERGKPLAGLDHRDTSVGEITLTSKRAQKVVARIRGYVRFDKPGIYDIDFLTNDGLDARIGGQRVGHFDGRQTCDSTFKEDVEVPAAGWYEVDILYFQRMGTSCLHMRMGPAGQKRLNWMPNSAFGH